MARYTFLTAWALEAPRERVWEAIYDQQRWPEWWPGVVKVEKLAEGDETGVGERARHVWRSRLPYDVSFEVETVRAERPHLLEGRASGELTGTGRWRFFESRDATAVLYEWDVATTKRWMNLLAPLAGPLFAWNHDHVMRGGGEGLSRLLGAPLIASS